MSGFYFCLFSILTLTLFPINQANAEGEYTIEGRGDGKTTEEKSEPSANDSGSYKKAEAAVINAVSGQKKPGCSEVTDGFCDKLWGKENSINGERGNISLADGKFYLGKSSQKVLSMIKKIDAEALIEALPRLPTDLQEALKKQNLFQEYKDVLAVETDDRRWKRRLADVETKIARAFSDVAEARTEKRIGKKPDEKVLEGVREYNQDAMDLSNEVLEAKYAKNANWKRVEKVYDRAKERILSQIDKLPFPESEKEKLRKKVSAIEVQLPYSDLRKWPGMTEGDKDNCSSTDLNAFYSPSNNKFTVCAGLFNGIQSESGLFMVIAHELSHSIDPNNCIEDHRKDSSAFIKIENQLIAKNGNAFSCEKWAEMKKELIATAAKIQPQKHLWSSLSDCLRNGVKLDEIDLDILKKLSLSTAKREVGDMADMQKMISLTALTKQLNDKEIKNLDYLNPDRVNSRAYGGFSMAPQYQSEIYWFTQEFQCQMTKLGLNEVSAAQRADLLEATAKEIIKIKAFNNFEFYNQCTTECRELQEHNFSRQTGEQFADWMAFAALQEELKLEKDLAMRRMKSGAAVGLFCGSPQDQFSQHSELNRAQKKFSMLPHPENRMRRLSLYGEKMRGLVECEKDQSLALSPSDCRLDSVKAEAIK